MPVIPAARKMRLHAVIVKPVYDQDRRHAGFPGPHMRGAAFRVTLTVWIIAVPYRALTVGYRLPAPQVLRTLSDNAVFSRE